MTDTWYAYAPVPNYWDDTNQIKGPIDLAEGVKFEPLPDWIKCELGLKDLNLTKRDAIRENTRFAFSLKYEASPSGELDSEWKGDKPISRQDRAEELINVANLALWIARPSRIGFEVVLHFDLTTDPASLRDWSSSFGLVPHIRDTDTTLSRDDFSLAAKLHSRLWGLRRDGTLSAAMRLLWKALRDPMWETRFLLQWVVMEAVFGAMDSRETTYRLSQRVAFFLGCDSNEVRDFFKKARDGYHWRSKVVHGLRLSKLSGDKSVQVLYDVESFIRKAMIRILDDSTLVEQFDGNKREEYLDGLIFERMA